MRCFIAIEIPEHIRARVFHRFENLQNQNLFDGKFVEKENLHLTLEFLGSLTNEEIDKIKEKLREIKFDKFFSAIGKTGVFDENHIKVIWIEVISDKLIGLQEKINEATLQIPMTYKKFNSHITVARVNSVVDKSSLMEEIKKIHFKGLDFEIRKFVLIKSELFSKGPKYKIIEEFNLNKN